MKYDDISDVNLKDEKLNRNIAIAISRTAHDKWVELREFFREHDINIYENLRRCLYKEFDQLDEVRTKKIQNLD